VLAKIQNLLTLENDLSMIDFENGSVFKLKKVDDDKFAKELERIMVPGETVLGCYKDVRDHVIFTDKRIIAVNVQGLTGKKKDFTIMPYSKISVFSVETSGLLDFDSELDLYFSGVGRIRFEFRGASDILDISRIISIYALK
jgi:hypothetical protein